MKLKHFICWLACSISTPLFAANLVPDTISIGNVRVAIHASAKPIFDKEFAMLGANKKYVASLVNKMRLYFPVIEPILAQGNVPDDFKFLCVQESALNPNAVSTSAAVGYWQFKLETAKDVGLKVDNEIDERRHILEATRGAVNYFNRNNGVLHNWMSTLLSYRVGLGTIKKLPYTANWANKTEIEVDSSTDWYVIRFLAYKHFWAGQLSTLAKTDSTSLVTYTNTRGKNLYDLSDELKVSYDDLKRYNAWILKDFVPDDKAYTLYHPSNVKTYLSETPTQDLVLTASVDSTKLYAPSPSKSKRAKNQQILSDQFEIRNHVVTEGDNLSSIATKYEMKLGELLKLNGIDQNAVIQIGQKIKVNRRIPMLEIIAQKLDEKSKNAPVIEKTVATAPVVVVEEMRKIETIEPKKSFYIDPADSREIVIKSDKKEAEKIIEQTQVVEKAPVVEVEKTNTQAAYHEVKAGETLFRISKIYQVSVDDLILWNGLGKVPTIQVGQKIKVKP
ncbi:LysM peptidoglycan-binding domain-containing protein [Aquirufa sp. OSTEICH-129V]|uniref:LysM peptidoglycan-binding domain-containing protein n=1 Tax=Aquirufa avitistagni TaxID=3104728 RepID=A0ABW6D9F3_9BACT